MEAMVVIRFDYACSQDELNALAMEFAERVKPTINGRGWKVFLNEPEKQRSAGLRLFTDAGSATAYAQGPCVQGLRQAPGITNCSVEVFETMLGPSLQADAPLQPAPAREPARAGRVG